MYTIVNTTSGLVEAIIRSSNVAPLGNAIRNTVLEDNQVLYKEPARNDIQVGDLCVLNQDGSRSYRRG